MNPSRSVAVLIFLAALILLALIGDGEPQWMTALVHTLLWLIFISAILLLVLMPA